MGKLAENKIEANLSHLPGWQVLEGKLFRRFMFRNYKKSLEFVNNISVSAEAEGHHPDIRFGWGYAEIYLTTHEAGGLTEKDFNLAKLINKFQ